MSRVDSGITIAVILACIYINTVQSCRADNLTSPRQPSEAAQAFSFSSAAMFEPTGNILWSNENVLSAKSSMTRDSNGNRTTQDNEEKVAPNQRSLTFADFENMLRGRFSFSSEYLLWSFQGNPAPPPLVTAASWEDAIPGALGQPHTQVLVGGVLLTPPRTPGDDFQLAIKLILS